MYVSCN